MKKYIVNFIIGVNVKSEIEANSIEEAKAIIKESLKDPNSYFTIPPILNKHPKTQNFINKEGNCIFRIVNYYENDPKIFKSNKKSKSK